MSSNIADLIEEYILRQLAAQQDGKASDDHDARGGARHAVGDDGVQEAQAEGAFEVHPLAVSDFGKVFLRRAGHAL